jgi:ubiquinone/menaquinone biosynthesis C-methylase UbiE
MDGMQISRVTRSKRQTMVAYDRLSQWYDLFAERFESHHREAAVRMLALQAGEMVLEVGCGTGCTLDAIIRFVSPSGRVHGIDISKGMLDIAKTRLKRAGIADRVGVQQCNALNLPFTASCFNVVFISFTLELFDTPEIPLVLAECMRVLRRKGRICVLGLSKQGRSNVITRLYEWMHERFPQYADCRPILIQQSLEQAGFHILEAVNRSLGGLPCASVLARAP